LSQAVFRQVGVPFKLSGRPGPLRNRNIGADFAFKHTVRTPKIILALFFALSAGTAAAQESVSISAQTERPSSGVKVHVYPNPATEYISIKLESAQISDVNISLHNIIGNTVEAESERVDDHEVRFRIKDLPVGYYLVSVRDKKGSSTGTVKFLKR
jgi:hypothetical protein